MESRDIRAKVINIFQPDIVCMVETWLIEGGRRWYLMTMSGSVITEHR